MIDVLHSIRRIIYRWVNTTTPITSDVSGGDTVINVESTKRWLVGEELGIFDEVAGGFQGNLHVAEILDNTRIRLSDPVRGSRIWRTSNSVYIRKMFEGQVFQTIFIGDPDVISQFPSIAIMGERKESGWLTIGSTKEDYKLRVQIYCQSDSNEKSYRLLLKITQSIEKGLKRNIFPLIGPYGVSDLTANYSQGDTFIKVADSSLYRENQSILIENKHRAEESSVACIVDSTTIQLHTVFANSYNMSDDAKIIGLNRFIFNSWPASIDYGFIHKGSLMHASTIDWFAWEQEIQETGGWKDPQLT